MLNIATPRLSPSECQDVQAALTAVADFGCAEPAARGAFRSRIGHALDTLLGPKKVSAALPAHIRPVRDFLCESGCARQISERHIPALTAQGFTRAQIKAMALLGA